MATVFNYFYIGEQTLYSNELNLQPPTLLTFSKIQNEQQDDPAQGERPAGDRFQKNTRAIFGKQRRTPLLFRFRNRQPAPSRYARQLDLAKGVFSALVRITAERNLCEHPQIAARIQRARQQLP